MSITDENPVTRRQGHGKKLSFYDFGATTFFASQFDQRFSYCLFVPEDYDEDGTETHELIVIVHGTGRTAAQYRDYFANFARERRCIVLAPLFPAGIVVQGDLANYKRIEFQGIRFDHILLSMIEEVAAKYRLKSSRAIMYGFSGGGQFCQRFFMLHPHRLKAVSIGAPGVVTLLDPDYDWWVGVRDVETRFGCHIDLEAMKAVTVHTVIGEEDTATWEIAIPRGSAFWMEGADLQGDCRIDRIEALAKSFEMQGIAVRRDRVPGVAHEPFKVLEPVEAFFADVLRSQS
ncbi:alpha/beta hydrolase [Brucella cytisi]|uniref:alpha/beta hydrolase n=1 Tax=Brucella cytisi TaxID=407152 RepID=UPI0035E01513